MKTKLESQLQNSKARSEFFASVNPEDRERVEQYTHKDYKIRITW